MEAEGPLLTIAEVSVALAGFASIVVAIRGANPSGWARQDRFGLANVFAASLAALLGSLSPFPLRHLGLADDTVWSISNGLFGFMPFIFTFLLASFPAGLVIYWTWNNMLSILQQYVIMKRAGVPIGNVPAKT